LRDSDALACFYISANNGVSICIIYKLQCGFGGFLAIDEGQFLYEFVIPLSLLFAYPLCYSSDKKFHISFPLPCYKGVVEGTRAYLYLVKRL
jgi:hypothetical protein